MFFSWGENGRDNYRNDRNRSELPSNPRWREPSPSERQAERHERGYPRTQDARYGKGNGGRDREPDDWTKPLARQKLFQMKKTFFNLTFDSSVYGCNTLNFSHTFHLK